MEKKKQNINPAVIGTIGAGGAVVGGASAVAAQAFAEKYNDVVQALHSEEPVLPAEVIDEEPVEAVIVDDAAPEAAHDNYSPRAEQSYEDSDYASYSDTQESVLAVEAVDPHDVDMDDLAEYGEVGVIVTEDGVEQNYAVFEMGDDQLAMIDLDGDGVFDVIADEEGHTMDLNDPSVPAFTVSDAEVQMQEQNGEYDYMAQTDLDNNSDTSVSGDYYGDDVIEV